MLSVKTIDVIFRVKASVHNKLGLSKAQYIQILKKMLNGFGIRNVPRKLAIIEPQPGLLSENKQKVDLWQFVILFVLAPLDLIQCLGRISSSRFRESKMKTSLSASIYFFPSIHKILPAWSRFHYGKILLISRHNIVCRYADSTSILQTIFKVLKVRIFYCPNHFFLTCTCNGKYLANIQ